MYYTSIRKFAAFYVLVYICIRVSTIRAQNFYSRILSKGTLHIHTDTHTHGHTHCRVHRQRKIINTSSLMKKEKTNEVHEFHCDCCASPFFDIFIRIFKYKRDILDWCLLGNPRLILLKFVSNLTRRTVLEICFPENIAIEFDLNKQTLDAYMHDDSFYLKFFLIFVNHEICISTTNEVSNLCTHIRYH